ncbi:MAG: TonB C-terminal domain-containing protein [Chakrabartia sp.]
MRTADAMDRAERTGLGLALVGHIVLLGALSLSLVRPAPKTQNLNPPIDVALVDAKSLITAAPDAVPEASGPPAPSETDLTTPQAEPTPPKPSQTPKDAARPLRLDSSLAAQLARAASREMQTPGTGRGTAATGSGTPAARTAAQLEASFIQALFAQIKRYWRAPTGVDAELLKTNIVVTLKPDGTIGSITVVSQSGVTENNENLKALHAERAISAIRRAAPFPLPPEHYAIWQSLGPITFDKRLN